jgi:ketosteroid isomerase-like protein
VEDEMTGPMQAVHDLSEAFAARDLDAALACFVPDDEIGYAGPEREETANDRGGVAALLGKLFAREEACSWQPTTVTIHQYGPTAYVFADANGVHRRDDGSEEHFAYRVSGLVELMNNRWRWRHCQGSEPTG